MSARTRIFGPVLGMVLVGITIVSAKQPALAQAARGKIIDTAFDTRPYLDRLQRAGVSVVGRYFARCYRGGWRKHQRLVDNGPAGGRASEAEEILSRGMGILSIYQYYSKSPCKFLGREGRFRKGRHRKVRGNFSCHHKRLKAPVVGAESDGCRPVQGEMNAIDDGRLDAQAAIRQAEMLGQPMDTAIYFGIDFDYLVDDRLAGRRVCLHVLDYLRSLRQTLQADGRYRLGVYGSGLTLRLASGTLPYDINQSCGGNQEAIADYTWLAYSRGFVMSRDVLKKKQWHLFQNRLDRNFRGLRVDYDIQNEAVADAGLWGRQPTDYTGALPPSEEGPRDVEGTYPD